jgi:hypothetical protein
VIPIFVCHSSYLSPIRTAVRRFGMQGIAQIAYSALSPPKVFNFNRKLCFSELRDSDSCPSRSRGHVSHRPRGSRWGRHSLQYL